MTSPNPGRCGNVALQGGQWEEGLAMTDWFGPNKVHVYCFSKQRQAVAAFAEREAGGPLAMQLCPILHGDH
jgi:hypothetical protein